MYAISECRRKTVKLIFMIGFLRQMSLRELPKARNNLPIVRHVCCSLCARTRNQMEVPYRTFLVLLLLVTKLPDTDREFSAKVLSASRTFRFVIEGVIIIVQGR